MASENLKPINIEPNYDNMFNGFSRDALSYMTRFANPGQESFTRTEVYDLIQALRMTLLCATSVDKIVKFREDFSTKADNVFKVVQREMSKPKREYYDDEDEYNTALNEWEQEGK